MECFDQDGGACTLTSIDFAKAFNTMSHRECLRMLGKKGASDWLIGMTGSFLLDRQMRFKVRETLSTGRHLRGGAPQGTILGNFLFVVTTDELEEGGLTTPRRESRGDVNTNAAQIGPMTPARSSRTPLMNPNTISTPTMRGQFEAFSPELTESDSDDDGSFAFFRTAGRRGGRLDSTSFESDGSIDMNTIDEHHPRPAGWRPVDLATLKYVDDFIGIEKIHLGDGQLLYTQRKPEISIRARQSEI